MPLGWVYSASLAGLGKSPVVVAAVSSVAFLEMLLLRVPGEDWGRFQKRSAFYTFLDTGNEWPVAGYLPVEEPGIGGPDAGCMRCLYSASSNSFSRDVIGLRPEPEARSARPFFSKPEKPAGFSGFKKQSILPFLDGFFMSFS